MAKTSSRRRIVSIDHAPEFLRFNKYIHRGYRVFHGKYDCLVSLFHLHNETINIWSHLLGAMFFLGELVYLDSVGEKGSFIWFLVAAVLCLLLSSIYHIFNCHSAEAYDQLLLCDYIGIFVLIFGSFYSALHYAFYCDDTWKLMYQGTMAVLCGTGILLAVLPYFSHEVKVYFFVGTIAFAIFPMAHTSYINGLDHVYYWLAPIAWYAAGLLLYTYRFPESTFPGRFDIIFSSHNLWHFCVFFAGLTTYSTLHDFHQSSMLTCPRV